MKRLATWLYVIAFLLVCALPLGTMGLFGEDESAEKRKLSSFPSLVEKDGSYNADFCSELNTYFSEHFSFRSAAVSAVSHLKAGLFATSNEDQVLLGKDGWLYFAKTLPDYTRQTVMTENEVARVGTVLDRMNDYVTASGAKFVVCSAPNKNTIYADNMPYTVTKGTGDTTLTKLNRSLKDRPYWVDLVTPLTRAKDEELLYHKRDSHWNNLGAAIAYKTITEALQIKTTDYLSLPRHTEPVWDGDLDTMLFPNGGKKDEQVIFEGLPETEPFEYTSRFRSEEDLTITTENKTASGKLLMFRDSFTNALLPFFARQYAEAEFSRITPYRMAGVKKGQYDAVVVELVERNLAQFLASAPVMEAAEISPTGTKVNLQKSVIQKENGLIHCYGLTDTVSTNGYAVTVKLGSSEKTFVALPITESALETEDRGTGYSFYLPLEYENATVSAATLIQ